MIAATMNTTVAAIERGDSRAMPQMPWPEVQPLPSRVPKPTNRPATAMVTMLPGICGIGTAWPISAAASGAKIRPAMKAGAPSAIVGARIEQAAGDAADAGNAAGEQHQQHRGKPDQRAADGRRDRSEIGHDVPRGEGTGRGFVATAR